MEKKRTITNKTTVKEKSTLKEKKMATKPKKIGSGSYGNIYDNGDGTVTKKFFSVCSFFVESFWVSFFDDTPGFCPLVGISFKDQTITMKKYPHDLFSFVDKLNYSKRLEAVRGMVETLENSVSVMHSFGVAHNDLRASNVLLEYDKNKSAMKVALCDFSLTSVRGKFNAYQGQEDEKEEDKDIYFVPDGEENTPIQRDMWALGALSIFLLTKNEESTTIGPSEKWRGSKTEFSYKENFDELFAIELDRRISSCLTVDPKKRRRFNKVSDIFSSKKKFEKALKECHSEFCENEPQEAEETVSLLIDLVYKLCINEDDIPSKKDSRNVKRFCKRVEDLGVDFVVLLKELKKSHQV